MATRATCCSRRAALGARDERPSAARKSPAPPPQQRSRGKGRRIRGGYFEPLSAARRGSPTAMSHVWRSTDASRRWARTMGVLPLLSWFRRSSGKPRAAHRSAKRENPNARWGSRSGARGTRTPDLLGAIQALSQLSYSPGNGRPYLTVVCRRGDCSRGAARLAGRLVPE